MAELFKRIQFLLECSLWIDMNSDVKKIAICIPVHGDSVPFQNALKSIDINVRPICTQIGIECILLVANSGSSISIVDSYWQGESKVISIPSDFYWAGAVRQLFISAQEYCPSHVLLMNHDVTLLSNSFIELINSVPTHPQSIVSAVSIIEEINQVENAGFQYTRGSIPFTNPFFESSISDLPHKSYTVDALNGRFVLFPALAANPSFLMPSLVPHYFADTVLSTKARRAGFKLNIIPTARVVADRSDDNIKKSRESCNSITGTYNCLFKAYSYRYVWGNLWGQFFLVDNPISGLYVSLKYTLLRIGKSIFELISSNKSISA
jgi:GT2 family glycosyltransferase